MYSAICCYICTYTYMRQSHTLPHVNSIQLVALLCSGAMRFNALGVACCQRWFLCVCNGLHDTHKWQPSPADLHDIIYAGILLLLLLWLWRLLAANCLRSPVAGDGATLIVKFALATNKETGNGQHATCHMVMYIYTIDCCTDCRCIPHMLGKLDASFIIGANNFRCLNA